jgi:glycosyltransferase involved in cell wall biosynthesis
MHVLVFHNRYRQSGGEDAVFRSEIGLLRSRLIKVTEFEMTNGEETDGLRDVVQLGFTASWSNSSYKQVMKLCADLRPDIAHIHNFWMRLSPSVHYACRNSGVATVQTLHNYRLLCLKADFLRAGQICQDCLGHAPWRGIVRRCYRDSLAASTAVAAMVSTHRLLRTWKSQVNAFIALSNYSRSKFIEGGIPGERVFVRPNFLEDRVIPGVLPSSSNVILFVGRLAEEKGIDLLLRAWRGVRKSGNGILRIIGDGPIRRELEQ